MTNTGHTGVLIDDCDLDLLDGRWKEHRQGYLWYNYATWIDGIRSDIAVYLHREIIKRVMRRPLNRTEEVDHINHNVKDNRRQNLRLIPRRINHQNRIKTTNPTSSKFIGVSLFKRTGKWMAQIESSGKAYYLGTFSSQVDAAKAYNSKAKELGFLTRNKIP